MTPAKQRNTAIDMTKGLLFLSVPMVHILNLESMSVLYPIMKVVTTAIMIVYFMLSGYTFRPGKRSWAENVKRRVKQLLLPWLLWILADTVIVTVYNLLSGSFSLGESLLGAWQGFLYNNQLLSMPTTMAAMDICIGQEAFWFLCQMFLADLVFFAVADLTAKDESKALLAAMALLGISGAMCQFLPESLPFTLEETCAYAAAMLLGCLAGKHRLLEENPLKGLWGAAGILVSLAVLSVIRLSAQGDYGDWGPRTMVGMFQQILCASLTLYAVVFALKALGSRCRPAETVLVWLGKHTLDLLMVHMPVCVLLRKLEPLADTEAVGTCLLTFALTVVLSLLFCFVKDTLLAKAAARKKAAV